MRTVRNSSRLLGGVPGPGGAWSGGMPVPGGVPAPGGCLFQGGCLLPGGGLVSQVDRQTGVNHNLRNFVADGNNSEPHWITNFHFCANDYSLRL